MAVQTQVNPLTVYSAYIAVKLHFEKGSYDAFKYNFKGPSKRLSTFSKSKEKFVYEKLARKYPKHEDLVQFFVANILAGNTWIRDMTDEVFIEWLGKIQSMSYRFKADMNKLLDYAENQELSFDDLLMIRPSTKQVPILTLLAQGTISAESVVTIDVLVSFLKRINKSTVSDPLGILSETLYRLEQYKPFIRSRINTAAAKNCIINLFTEAGK
jgi:hypothetical protein